MTQETMKSMTVAELSQVITAAKAELVTKLKKIVEDATEAAALHGIQVGAMLPGRRRGRKAAK